MWLKRTNIKEEHKIQNIHLKIHNLLPQTSTTFILQKELDKIEPGKGISTITLLYALLKN